MTVARQFRAGQSAEDHCRSCHEDRTHTVIVVDGNAQPLRVSCDFCRSEHNYRGGPRMGAAAPAVAPHREASAARHVVSNPLPWSPNASERRRP